MRPFRTPLFPLRRLASFVLMLAALPMGTFAQSGAPGWLEETMYSSGKINTVVAVVTVVLLGLAMWMAAFDRRLARTEQRMKKDQ